MAAARKKLGAMDVPEEELDPSGRYMRRSIVMEQSMLKTVYKAFDTEEAIEVAWSRIPLDLMSPEEVEAALQELQSLQKVQHRNLVASYAAWYAEREDGAKCMNLILELMTSGSLKEYLRSVKSIKLKVIRRWCSDILEGIQHLHAQTPPVLHRNIKCDKMYVNGHLGEVKIGDLGLATFEEGERGKAFNIIASPEYMAPELFDENYTEKVDIYAFGMCMLEMITMETPYSEDASVALTFRKVLQGEKPQALQRIKESDFKRVIDLCLGPAEQRPSAQELSQHDLFSRWSEDSGKLSNVDLTSSDDIDTSELNPDQRRDDMVVGSLRVHTIASMARDVVISHNNVGGPYMTYTLSPRHNDEEVGGQKHKVWHESNDVPRSPQLHGKSTPRPVTNDRGEFRISVCIPIEGVLQNVEFMFEPKVDSAESIANEMRLEFQLSEEQEEQVRYNIELQKQEYCAEDDRMKKLAQTSGAEAELSQRSMGDKRPSARLHYVSTPPMKLEIPDANGSVEHAAQDHSVSRATVNASVADKPTERVGGNEKLQKQTSLRTRTSNSNPPLDIDEGVAATALDRPQTDPAVLSRLVPATKSSASDDDAHANAFTASADLNSLASAPASGAPAPPTVMNAASVGSTKVEGGSFSYNRRTFAASMSLMNACNRGDLQTVRSKLAEGVSPNFADYDRRTPMHLAAIEGHAEIVELLLELGADPNAKDRWGSTAFMGAEKNNHSRVLEVYRRHDVEPEICDADVLSMELMDNCMRGLLADAREKVVGGASVTYADFDGRTPLHLAAAEGHARVCELLLANGARVDAVDRLGRTPLENATRGGHKSTIKVLKRFVDTADGATTESLAGAGGSRESLKPGNDSEFSRKSSSREALADDATLAIKRERAHGVRLMRSSHSGDTQAVERLIDLGVDVNFSDYDRRSALHLAATEGHLDTIEALVHAGANVSAVDRWGVTPLDEAKQHHRIDAVGLLERGVSALETAEESDVKNVNDGELNRPASGDHGA